MERFGWTGTIRYLHRISPAPNLAHQRITTALTGLFWQHLREKDCQVFTAPFDVRLDDKTVVQPDICVVCDAEKLDVQGCNNAPDLVIEVLSPGNSKREMRHKFMAYETAGVREYWIVSPYDKAVLVYTMNEEDKFIGLPPYTDEQVLSPVLFPDLAIDLGELFGSKV